MHVVHVLERVRVVRVQVRAVRVARLVRVRVRAGARVRVRARARVRVRARARVRVRARARVRVRVRVRVSQRIARRLVQVVVLGDELLELRLHVGELGRREVELGERHLGLLVAGRKARLRARAA